MTEERVKVPELYVENVQDQEHESIYMTWYGLCQAFAFALMFKSVITLQA